MKQIIVSIIIFLLLVGCNDRRLDFEEVSDAMGHAEKYMNDNELVTTSASSVLNNQFINFRLVVKDRITNEQAKLLIEELVNDIESNLSDTKIFRNKYDFKFDIKSEKDGEILYKGRLDQDQVWWQF